MLVPLLTLPLQAWAAPGFDLDLKELKKPLAPSAPAKKKGTAARKKQNVSAKQTRHLTAKTKKTTTTVPAPPQPSLVKAEAVMAPSELALTGTDACQLAERMAVAVAHSVPAAELLHGLELKPVAAVRYADLNALVICGLTKAESYTYARLLAEHEVQLISIASSDSPAQVARAITDGLALTYELETDGQSGTLVYLIPGDKERQRPLRLTIQQ